MRKRFKNVVTFLILLITLVYGIGDYLKWWDNIRGRTLAMKGWQILADKKLPIVLIRKHEPEFQELNKIILAHTNNERILENHKNRLKP